MDAALNKKLEESDLEDYAKQSNVVLHNGVISDANYFFNAPSGTYSAIGQAEANSPNDGSGLHQYITSKVGSWFC